MTYQSAQNLNVMGSLASFFVTSAEGSGEADIVACNDVRVRWGVCVSEFRK